MRNVWHSVKNSFDIIYKYFTNVLRDCINDVATYNFMRNLQSIRSLVKRIFDINLQILKGLFCKKAVGLNAQMSFLLFRALCSE